MFGAIFITNPYDIVYTNLLDRLFMRMAGRWLSEFRTEKYLSSNIFYFYNFYLFLISKGIVLFDKAKIKTYNSFVRPDGRCLVCFPKGYIYIKYAHVSFSCGAYRLQQGDFVYNIYTPCFVHIIRRNWLGWMLGPKVPGK